MGAGIAQVAATAGHPVSLSDANPLALSKAKETLASSLQRLESKGRIAQGEASDILSRISFTGSRDELDSPGLVIEAIVETLEAKRALFRDLEASLGGSAILATNTSSLSIASLSAGLRHPDRFLGLHFFNPAPLMRLVEVVPGLATDPSLPGQLADLLGQWGKTPVMAKDTPGFIVNRIARPYYGEALRIVEEGLATPAQVDEAMTRIGGFRMGPFQLMDLIGNDINFNVTRSVFDAFFQEARFRPSILQQRLVEAGYLGRKTGLGFYRYDEVGGTTGINPVFEAGDGRTLSEKELDRIVERILAMLINQAVDALEMGIASAHDIDLAMTLGVNYPKGLLQWADERGAAHHLEVLMGLHSQYLEERYRPASLLRRTAAVNGLFIDRQAS